MMVFECRSCFRIMLKNALFQKPDNVVFGVYFSFSINKLKKTIFFTTESIYYRLLNPN